MAVWRGETWEGEVVRSRIDARTGFASSIYVGGNSKKRVAVS